MSGALCGEDSVISGPTGAVTLDSHKFAALGRPRTVWAIGAIHGEIDHLIPIHDHIANSFDPGDRLVYLGNFIGRGPSITETVAEMLSFRRHILSIPSMLASDVVYLRGAQEEMWQKLLQLQFAPNPGEVLSWMLDQGVGATLAAYGGDAREGMASARDGAVQLTRWTNRLREAIRKADSHSHMFSALRRAAFSDPVRGEGDTNLGAILCVSAGLDPDRPLATQGDSFWWSGAGFDRLDQPYEGYTRVLRGFDPDGAGVQTQQITVTLDGGAGRGGQIAAGRFGPGGEILDLITA